MQNENNKNETLKESKTSPWLDWAVKLQAIAQAGLTYGKDVYDRERYEQIRDIAAEMISLHSGISKEKVVDLFCSETGYQTPKLDTRAAVFQDGKILLVKENNGTWEKLKKKEVKVTALNGPALCFSNHEANGETILRTGKVVKNQGDEHGMWNYSKLCFNTKYPWEAAPAEDVESQQYVLHDVTTDTYDKANVTFWNGQKEDVLYRRQFFGYNLGTECHWMQAMNLADFTVPYGIVRVDKLRLFKKPITLTLGAYGFPDNGTRIVIKEQEYAGGKAKAIILKGQDATGKPRQLAMTIYDGWDDIAYVESCGTNPDSEHSIIVYAKLARNNQNHYESSILISQVITKEWMNYFQ